MNRVKEERRKGSKERMPMMVDPVIGFDELAENCFSSKTLKTAIISKIKWGPYVIRLSWKVKGLPFGEQIIWLLYSNRSRKEIDEAILEVTSFIKKTGRSTVFIENFNFESMTLPLEVSMLVDGKGSCGALTFTLNNGATGHFGWFAGQGRVIDSEDRQLNRLLHLIVSNYFSNAKRLKNDPIMKAGQTQLLKLKEKDHGH